MLVRRGDLWDSMKNAKVAYSNKSNHSASAVFHRFSLPMYQELDIPSWNGILQGEDRLTLQQ